MNELDPVLEYLSPLRSLIEDEGVSEIRINGPGSIWYEREGLAHRFESKTISSELLDGAVRRIAHAVGQEVEDRDGNFISPALNCRFGTAARLAVLFPPHSLNGIALCLRKFNAGFTLDELLARRMLTGEQAEYLKSSVAGRRNILFSGATGTGKSTILNVFAGEIPAGERILVIENPAELGHCRLDPNDHDVVRWEAMEDYSQTDLLRQALRFNPDRIIIGEFRGQEASVLLELMNTGHEGTLSSLHANSAYDALERFVLCVLKDRQAPEEAVVRRLVRANVHVVVHVVKEVSGLRRVSEIMEVDDANE